MCVVFLTACACQANERNNNTLNVSCLRALGWHTSLTTVTRWIPGIPSHLVRPNSFLSRQMASRMTRHLPKQLNIANLYKRKSFLSRQMAARMISRTTQTA